MFYIWHLCWLSDAWVGGILYIWRVFSIITFIPNKHKPAKTISYIYLFFNFIYECIYFSSEASIGLNWASCTAKQINKDRCYNNQEYVYFCTYPSFSFWQEGRWRQSSTSHHPSCHPGLSGEDDRHPYWELRREMVKCFPLYSGTWELQLKKNERKN